MSLSTADRLLEAYELAKEAKDYIAMVDIALEIEKVENHKKKETE